ncbi:flagellar biosynthesis protein FlhF [Leadbettera azotonutricia]|uniref:Flagellar biosynthesis protein FlhF n=1 Tax=Leadbettera azotonutricia (strain ATCC BAA-888 / DSM 13862 / ZAS-9) TaxID=545695 RepID=F5YEU7_LEAAZ|nr:flagellar biosynthesis protein FlhF [Leadbettera azotonutricia]AEF81883.1 flagellar biosynthesis protein FlhF (Flagella-associated GTP-bindingprotein) [Leadbettera azotonutricia ZAS-9]
MQQFFVEQAETYDEACRKVWEKYGDRANIVLRKTVILRGGLFGLFPKEGVEVSGPIPPAYVKTMNSFATVNGSATIGSMEYSPSDYPRKAPARESTAKTPSYKEPLDFEEEKKKVLAAAGRSDPAIQQVLKEVLGIKERMEAQALPSAQDEHPTLKQLEEVLVLNDFSASYRAMILGRAKKEFSIDALNDYDAVQDKALEWIGESITIYKEEKFHRLPRIIILVGPTGVGKTTTIAKLAANYGIDNNGKRIKQVALITIDTFRIGAKQQLEAYGKILEFPCYAVEDHDELKKTIALHSDGTDLILIDTIGKSPRDMVKLGEMKQLLNACGSSAEIHLAISAGTKSSDIKEILQQFEPFNYHSVVITKLDETIRSGNVIGILSEKQKSVSYITNGQKVPADIRRASVIQLLANLEGFRVNRTKLEQKFPYNDNDQMRQWR